MERAMRSSTLVDRRQFVARASVAASAIAAPSWGWLRHDVWRKSRELACFDVRVYGARGDGVTFDDAPIVAAVEAAKSAGGGAIVFPPATYRVANGKELTFRDCSNVVFYGPGATLRNDTDTGRDGGVVTFRGSSRNISLVGLAFETATASPNSYDNTLSFYQRPPDMARDILVRGCRFLRASNKHINIEGPVDNVVIERCYFEGSNFNSNPIKNVSRFGAIYFDFRSDAKYDVTNITVQKNYFADNWQFCVSMDEFDFKPNHSFFRNIRIVENTFRNSTGGLWVRGEYVWIQRNFFDSVGMRHLEAQYRYMPSLGRYLSVKRAGVGQVAAVTSTVLVQRAAVIEVANARRVWVEENTFVNCGRAQLEGATPPVTAVYVAAEGAERVALVGNRAYEPVALETSVPTFDCKGAGADGSLCEDNNVVVGNKTPITPSAPWPNPSAVAGFKCVTNGRASH